MINTEITVNIGSAQSRIFTSRDYFECGFDACPLHKHKLTEIQIITEGVGEFTVLGDRISVSGNEMLVIPKNTYHQRCEVSQSTKVITFQTTEDALKHRKYSLNPWIVKALKDDIAGAGSKLPFYFGIILSEFTDCAKGTVMPVQDREFLIYEYFSLNYNRDISLSDIAKLLNLSEKQTERIIKQCTGKSFRQNLASYRIDAAAALMANGDLSLTEIAERVGYKSYSGFWKAYNNK